MMMNKEHLLSLVEDYLKRYPKDKHAERVHHFLENQSLFWQRENIEGHITASAWVLSEDQKQTILTHHANLKIWVQLGGHIENEDQSIWDAAKREVLEESGVTPTFIDKARLFDIDVHLIPESKKGVPAHYHYDLRVLMYADSFSKIRHDEMESIEVQWVNIDEVHTKSTQESVMRMVRKTEELSLTNKYDRS
jgi:8-oxo-dGTP pyrophosphatase MutT (NUDIX family)